MLSFNQALIIASIPSFITLAIYCINKYFERYSNKRAVLKERLEKFYNPFYVQYLKAFSLTRTIQTAAPEINKLELFWTENIYYTSTETQDLIRRLHSATFAHDQTNDNAYADLAVSLYSQINQAIYKEHVEICRKLGLQPPPEYF